MLKKIAGAAVLLALLGWYVDHPTRTTPGFFIDESSIAYNALTISRTGLDEHDARMPLYFEAFGEYKNPVYIYLLAAVFRVAGPSILAARMLSILLGYVAAMILGLLVRRQTRSDAAGAFAFIAALLTPWLFEIGRLVFEVALFPLALALALFAIAEAARRQRMTPRVVIACAASLAIVTYTYTAGRFLGPVMALGLALLLPRRRVRDIAAIWCAYAVTMIPLVIFAVRHPHALTARLNEVGVAQGNFLAHWLASFSPRFLFMQGDLNARHHIAFGGELFVSVGLAALVGLVAAVRDARRDPWSRYLLFALLIAPVPGAITQDDPHALRLITMAVVIVILAGNGVATLLALQTEKRLRVLLVGTLFVAVIAQGIVFRQKFVKLGPVRYDEFCVTYPYVFDVALATRQPLGVENNPYYINAWWYGALHGIDRELLPRYERDAEPRGTVMLGIAHDCPTCRVLVDLRWFWAYRRE
jgi:4-amino-4-deoxy-L-arabinose transferase-like glycosyltransferase